jgi:hypothetical protein
MYTSMNHMLPHLLKHRGFLITLYNFDIRAIAIGGKNNIKMHFKKFDILLTVYHYVSQQRNQLNTLSLSQTLYCVVIRYMFRASSVHLQEALHYLFLV